MNWNNSTGLDAATEALLKNRIKKYLDEDSSASGGDDAQAVHALILELYGIYKSASGPIGIYKAQQEIIAKGKQWDTDDPALAQIQKYVNRVLAGKFNSATGYLEKAIQHKSEVQKIAAADRLKGMGQSGANAKHANNNQVKARQMQLPTTFKTVTNTPQKKLLQLIWSAASPRSLGQLT